LLPTHLTEPLEAALVRSLDEAELNRALNAATSALTAELVHTDAALATRLGPILTVIGDRQCPFS
jgi:hypothetical protein